MLDAGVEVRADATLQAIAGTQAATEADWGREYLDSIIAARVVEGARIPGDRPVAAVFLAVPGCDDGPFDLDVDDLVEE